MKNYILIITMHADPAMPPGYDEWGGTHTYMKELLDYFGEKKIYCILITRRSMEQLPYKEDYNPFCQIIRLTNGKNEPMEKQNLRFYHEENIKNILELVAKEEGYPLVIHSVYWNSGRLAMEISQTIGVPFVHSVISNARGRIYRGAKEPIKKRPQYEQDIYTHATKILCVSEDEKQDLIRFYHIDPEKIIVCGQYIANSFLTPAHDFNGFPIINSNLSEGEQHTIALNYNKALNQVISMDNFWLYKAFTYFGRMDINKGVIPIIKAWYSLYKRYEIYCPPLWLAGGSLPEIEAIRKEINLVITDLCDLEKKCKIFWWGYLNTDGLSTILLKSLVLLAHSLYEPGGRVVVEAMSEGVPVIATPNGFAKDNIHNWENGFLVDYNDIQALSQRMEHFLRQPILSNTLGLNSKECAKNILYRWDFLNAHLRAYGIDVDNIASLPNSPKNYYQHKLVHIYPYCSNSLTNGYIKKVYSKYYSEEVISIKDINPGICTSDMKELVSQSGTYIVKHVVQRLATSPFYNPLSKDILVRDSQFHYDVEVNVYQRLESPLLRCTDSFHRLLYFKKLETVPTKNVFYIDKCISYLYSRKNILTYKEKKLYVEQINCDCQSLENIKNLMESLEQAYPAFYFECSGMFSNRLSWKIAPYLTSYNAHILPSDVKYFLEDISTFFSSFVYQTSLEQVRDINLDIEQRHIMTDGQEFYLIDHEKTSIGIIEMDIASFLYDYYKNSEYANFLSFWLTVKAKLVPYKIQICELLSAIAYRFFYDLIVENVLEMHTNLNAQQDLYVLKELMEKYNCECNFDSTPSR